MDFESSICKGQKAFNTKKAIEETLSEEILNAYKLSNQSAAIAKKLELERQADASR
jgi:ribosomal protein S7